MLRQNATLLVLCIRFQHPIFRLALYRGAHSSSRNSGHPNCCLASWGPKTLEYFPLRSQAKAFSELSSECLVLFIIFFSPRLSSLPEVFLGSSFVPDDCLAVRMHTCFWCFASFPPLAPASAVHTSSESNSSVYRLNSWLHSSGLRVSARRFWWNPFKLFGWICLQCVHLGMKCRKEAVGRTLCWGLHAVCVLLKVFCGYCRI